MLGLFNAALKNFIEAQNGSLIWASIAEKTDLTGVTFEPLLEYSDESTNSLIAIACQELGRAPEDLLEDLGTYLVTADFHATLRRLLRFSGCTFRDFVSALDELPARARLALDTLKLPDIDVVETGSGVFEVGRHSQLGVFVDVLHGAIRGMADDYGALVTTSVEQGAFGARYVRLVLHQAQFTTGRQFDMAQAG